MLYITNTLTGKKEQFTPYNGRDISLYVCGITPYDQSHLGHGRCYVIFDTLYRLLQFLGYNVRYCRNFTDIDDKLLRKAEERFNNKARYSEIADEYITKFHHDMSLLNCLKPTYEPRVTETIPQIIAFIETLIAKGYAYQCGTSVYFHIPAFPAYGALSKHNLADLCAGARVDIDSAKKNPLDFALWKGEAEGEFWHSPWGYGRPGWHIECSVMAREYLGDIIDIHGGGLDLVFPHHENERAQSQAFLENTYVRYWMHNGFVQINKEKMSKSLGNFFTLASVFETYDPMVIRYYLLTHHYRAPLDFSLDDLEAAEKSYRRLIRAFTSCDTTISGYTYHEMPVAKKMIEMLCNDLNTPGMFGILFESLSALTKRDELCMVRHILTDILGLTLQALPEKTVEITPEIQLLIDERNAARAQKDWARADALRDQLHGLGYKAEDKKLL